MSPFDNVSLEIYDEIFSQVLCPIEEIQHVYRRVEPDNEDGIHCFDFIRGVGHGNFGYYVRWWPRPSDLRIRLVSKAFDHAMRRAYFHNTDVQLQAYKANSVGCIEKYIISPDSSLPSQMTRLRIELSPGIPWQGMSFFERDLSDQQDFPSARVIYREEMAENHANRHNLLAFLPVIPRAIAKMPRLERLIVNLNEDWRSHGPTWDIPGYISDDDDGEIYGPKIDLVLLDKVRKSIESIFTSPDNSLPFLTYLRLTLPCAYDFTCINKVISDEVATNLRHLYLEYIDGTGPQGDLSYTISCEGGDDNDGSEDYPFSTLQKKYPNIEHNHGIRDLVHRCRNLESLGLAGTQPIDLRNISWQPNRRGLKNIYLCRAIIGHEDFCQLLCSPSSIGTSSHTPSKRVALQMEDVELSSGTFADVWSELITSQSLRYLDLHNLVYCREHPNFLSLRRHNHRPWEIISQIWSEHKPDEKLLASLIRKTQEWGGQVSESMGMFAEDQEEGRGRMQRKVA